MYEPIIDAVPDAVDVEGEDPGTYSTLVTVAYCPIQCRSVAVICELAYTSTDGTIPASNWFHEFSFSIAVVDRYGEEEPFYTQDRFIARPYLPEAVVPMVMPIVLRSLDALIVRVKPKILYRVTKMRNPSPKALVKHELVTNHLHELGYEMLQQGVDSFQRRFWALKGPH